MFGRGAMTMYHFTDVPMLISGSYFLILVCVPLLGTTVAMIDKFVLRIRSSACYQGGEQIGNVKQVLR